MVEFGLDSDLLALVLSATQDSSGFFSIIVVSSPGCSYRTVESSPVELSIIALSSLSESSEWQTLA